MGRKQEQIRGCLLGSAAGDALGYCVDSLRLDEIHTRYGPDGIRGYDTLNGIAPISSHTQLGMFTANGLLFGATRGALRGNMAPYVNYLLVFYRDWVRTQRVRTDLHTKPYAWLCQVEELYARRCSDPGVTFALMHNPPGTMDEPVNRSQGSAGLTRCIPIGLFLSPKEMRREEICLLGAESAALTQGDPLGFLPAAVLTGLLNRIVYDRADSFRNHLLMTLSAAQRQFGKKYPSFVQLRDRIAQAADLANDPRTSQEVMELLRPRDAAGILASACYICLRHPGDYDRGIVAAVNHSGESAAVGAVVGALLGAQVGMDGIPEFYLEPLELRDIMEELAVDLFQGCPFTQGSELYDDVWYQKYVQGTYEKGAYEEL